MARKSELKKKLETSTNKLDKVKPFIIEWESIYNRYRKYEVKLSWLRIGCTRLFNRHLQPRDFQVTNVKKCNMWKPQTDC